jgi:uncharacterized cysteine cluster protein YcgN (CxxCxxCC family)
VLLNNVIENVTRLLYRTLKRNTLGICVEQTKNQFWKTKSLMEMTKAEWESLCDHCSICCLHCVRDEHTSKIMRLAVSCQYLDTSVCRCLVYECRNLIAQDCIALFPDKIRQMNWLPKTCAYRSLAEGRKLEWWHPLVSGNPNTVHEAGISVQEKVLSGKCLHPEDLEHYKHSYLHLYVVGWIWFYNINL